nr:thioredoxin reductase 1, cytoplasmic [Parambassis ranga]XP_028256619.1 thioredoxin reductase 1, cytoplasmic [Parambassis ranga]
MGPNAGDMLQGFVTAMKCGLTKQQLDATVGIHPGTAQKLNVLLALGSDGEVSEPLEVSALSCDTVEQVMEKILSTFKAKFGFPYNTPIRDVCIAMTAIIESILTSSITVWYTGARDKYRLQRLQPAISPRPVRVQDSEACRSDHS